MLTFGEKLKQALSLSDVSPKEVTPSPQEAKKRWEEECKFLLRQAIIGNQTRLLPTVAFPILPRTAATVNGQPALITPISAPGLFLVELPTELPYEVDGVIFTTTFWQLKDPQIRPCFCRGRYHNRCEPRRRLKEKFAKEVAE